MLTGRLPLQIYQACRENAPLIISTVDTAEKIWQSHSNYFSIIWIREGEGLMENDFSRVRFTSNTIFCFNNYQAFALFPRKATRATLLLFHPNFFCIETYQHEVGCNGVLFNQVYDNTPIEVSSAEGKALQQLLDSIQQEDEDNLNNIATGELVFSYLKILLVKLTRLKAAQVPDVNVWRENAPYLERLVYLIDEHFSREHTPAFYAGQLHMTVKNLSNSCRRYFKKSLSALIHEKILLKAKWELLHTDAQVKGIANKLGFKDEYYFGRFFKKHIGLPPKHFRESEWKIRKGYLSIP